ncbi:MAG TPA: efflux RND transporter periplasmic adaptor subunit, partial [Patescibacteria group bacterium]|nr:efflux RND transporter periplasmic adaptor subunit [Patescibacteria group bacterium]
VTGRDIMEEENNWGKRLKAALTSNLLQELLRAAGIFLALAAVISIIVFAAGTYGIQWGVKKEPLHPEVAGVTVTVVREGQVDEYYETSGAVQAIRVGMIAAKSAGRITAIDAKIGDNVTEGQLLITLDDEEIKQRLQGISLSLLSAQNELDAAQQQLSRSDANYQRFRGLYNVQAISRRDNEKVELQRQEDLDAVASAQGRVDRMRAARDEAQALTANSRLSAPFAGVVTERKVDVGNNILPEVMLMKVEDTSQFVMEGLIDWRLAEKVKPGQKAVVLIEELQLEETVPITEVVPSANMPGMYVVRALFTGPGLKSGLSGKMKIPASQRAALMVPAAAVVNLRGQIGVYVVKPDRIISFRQAQLAGRYDDQMEVLGGLYAGEEVVIAELDRMADGVRVKDAQSQ